MPPENPRIRSGGNEIAAGSPEKYLRAYPEWSARGGSRTGRRSDVSSSALSPVAPGVDRPAATSCRREREGGQTPPPVSSGTDSAALQQPHCLPSAARASTPSRPVSPIAPEEGRAGRGSAPPSPPARQMEVSIRIAPSAAPLSENLQHPAARKDTPGRRFELLRCRAPVAFEATAFPD